MKNRLTNLVLLLAILIAGIPLGWKIASPDTPSRALVNQDQPVQAPDQFPTWFVDQIKRFENSALMNKAADYEMSAWIDRHGRLTPVEIGYGFTQDGIATAQRVGMVPAGARLPSKMSKAQADCFLVEIILPSYGRIVDSVVTTKLQPHERMALISFTYNCGEKNLRKLVSGESRLNGGNRDSLRRLLPCYSLANGKRLRGLERRRQFEVDLFFGKFEPEPSRNRDGN